MSRPAVVLVNVDSGGLVSKVEHLGLGYLAAVLKADGVAARVVDGSFHRLSPTALHERVTAGRPDLIGFTTYYSNMSATLAAIARLREDGFRGHITLGGHHATFNAAAILRDRHEVSSVVRGEGEGAIRDLAAALAAGADWRGIANVAYAGEAGVVENPCRPLIEDLDQLPVANRGEYGEFLRRYGTAAMVSSRGCHGTCSFCSIRSFYGLSAGRAWRARSAASIVDEIEMLVRDYGTRRINFLDDEFLGPGRAGRERALAIAEEMRRRPGVGFNILCRPDALDEEVLRALQAAGLFHVSLGVESWVPRQLALYGKGVSAEQNQQAIAMMRRLGLDYMFFLIPADPEVSAEELLINLDHAAEAGPEHAAEGFTFSRLMVLSGTRVAGELAARGLLRETAGPEYLDAPGYDFTDPRVRMVYEQWPQAYGEYVELRRLVTTIGMYEGAEGGSDVPGRAWHRVLARSAHALFRELVRECRDGQPGRLMARVTTELDRIVYGEAVSTGADGLLPERTRVLIAPVWAGTPEAYGRAREEIAAAIARAGGGPVADFGQAVRRALRREALELCQRVVTCCQGGDEQAARMEIAGALERLRGTAAEVVAAADDGRLAGCRPVVADVGGETIHYPPEAVRRALERLVEGMI